MKKLIAILLSITFIIGSCVFVVSAADSSIEQVNEKIFEYRKCYSQSADDEVIRANVIFDVEPLSEEEKAQTIFERCGLTKSDIIAPGFNMTNEESAEWHRKRNLYSQTKTQLDNELEEQNCKPFFDYMDLGVEFKYGGALNKYHDQMIVASETLIYIYLTKAEITKASQSDYVTEIKCLEKLNKDDLSDPPLGTYSEKIDYFSDDTRYFTNAADNDLILATIYFTGAVVNLEAALNQAYIQCGYEPGSSFGYDLGNYNSWSDEDKANYKRLSELVWKTRGDIVNEQIREIMLPKVLAFFDSMGIEPVTDNGRIKYRDKYMRPLSSCAVICLTKSEVIRAAELDCVENIIVENPENDYYVNHGVYPGDNLPQPNPQIILPNQPVVRFLDSLNWGTAFLYAWDKDGNELCGEWPGILLETETKKWDDYWEETFFVCTVPDKAYSIVINNGDSEQSEPIYDFGAFYGYWFNGMENELGQYKVTGYNIEPKPEPDDTDYEYTFYNDSLFNQVYEYAYDAVGNALLGEWPGALLTDREAVTNPQGDSVGDKYKLSVPKGTYGIILSDGFGNRTEDITVLSKKQSFWLDGSMNAQGHFLVTPYPGYIDPVVENKPGDVNGDNVLDVLDSVEIQKNSVEKIQFTEAQKRIGDYNKDGSCDVLDAVEIQKAVVDE